MYPGDDPRRVMNDRVFAVKSQETLLDREVIAGNARETGRLLESGKTKNRRARKSAALGKEDLGG